MWWENHCAFKNLLNMWYFAYIYVLKVKLLYGPYSTDYTLGYDSIKTLPL